MIVRLTRVLIDEIDDEQLRHRIQATSSFDEIDYRRGSMYEVLGIVVRHNDLEYILCPEQAADGPTILHRAWFETVTHSPRADWRWKFDENEVAALLPAQWALIPFFLERLADGEPGAVFAFSQLRDSFGEKS